MTVIATASNPRFSVSRVDIDRGGPTYTKDTLRDLHALNPDADLYFITGADALASILSWQNWEDLFSLARFVGVSRPGYELDGEHIAEAMKELPADALTLVEVPALAISSTRLPQARRPEPADLVPGARRGGAVRRPSAGSTERTALGDRGTGRDGLRRSRPAWRPWPRGPPPPNWPTTSSSSTCPSSWSSPTASSSRRPPTSVRSTPSSTRSRRRCALAGYKPARREGAREGRWVLLDYVDIVVHIQHQDERNFYALDRLWRDCPVVPVDLERGEIADMRIRRLVMLRHGQTEFNAGSRMQGQLDTDLSDLGRDQAVAAAEVLAKRQPLVDRVLGPAARLDTAVVAR